MPSRDSNENGSDVPQVPTRPPTPAVAVVAPAPFLLGGIERLTWDVVRALKVTTGNGVVVAALLGRLKRGSERWLYFEGESRLTLFSKARFSRVVIWDLARRNPRTLLFCMHVNQSQLALAARRLWGNPFAVWAHGDEVWHSLQPLPRFALSRADLVLCSSDFTRESLLRRSLRSPDRTVTVRPGVSPACFTRAAEGRRRVVDTTPIILSVGRLVGQDDYKGFDLVVRALPGLSKQVTGVSYVVIGGGPGAEGLIALARSLGVDDRLTILEGVTDEALWDAYENSRVFAMPSGRLVQGRMKGEGLGIAFLEAGMFGRPIVAARVGGASETVLDGTTGRLVPPGDVGAVMEALLPYLEDARLAERVGSEGRKWALREFSPLHFSERLLDELDRWHLLPRSVPR
jgi:glycosyltransferase involved in cell wall biosynthesis